MQSSTPRPFSCLIVEDEVVIGMDIEDALEEAGYQPLWVASAEKALELISDKAPDVAIIDVRLRDSSCIEVARELRRRDIPFIIHSGSTLNDIPSDITGATWLSKPAEVSEILNAVDALLQRPTD